MRETRYTVQSHGCDHPVLYEATADAPEEDWDKVAVFLTFAGTAPCIWCLKNVPLHYSVIHDPATPGSEGVLDGFSIRSLRADFLFTLAQDPRNN